MYYCDVPHCVLSMYETSEAPHGISDWNWGLSRIQRCLTLLHAWGLPCDERPHAAGCVCQQADLRAVEDLASQRRSWPASTSCWAMTESVSFKLILTPFPSQ